MLAYVLSVLFFILAGAYFVCRQLFFRLKNVVHNVESRASDRLLATEKRLADELKRFHFVSTQVDVKNTTTSSDESSFFQYFETQYAHTLRDQHYLFQSLLKEVMRQAEDELVLLSQLIQIDKFHSILSKETLTIIGTLDADIYKRILPTNVVLKNVINPLRLGCGNVFELHHLIHEIDTSHYLLILNPYIASILFLYPLSIKLLVPKITKKLIFPSYIKKSPLQIEWNNTFRAEESADGSYWRWALYREAHLFIVNNSPTTKRVTIAFNVWSLDDSPFMRLKIYFLNECSEHAVENVHTRLEYQIDVPPGRHKISMASNNSGVKHDNWPQTLYFAVANFSVKEEGGQAQKLNQSKGCDNDIAVFTIHENEYMRYTLHGIGFYEITATAFSKNNGTIQQLETTRYLYQDKGYQYLDAEAPPPDFVPDNIWYFANRAAELREE